MESLKALIRNLAFILLLATFLEMILPNKAMRGFVQLVMGLFVLAAVLNPLAELVSIDMMNEIPAWVEVSSSDLPVLATEDISVNPDTGKSAVREQYKRILINQIKALVMTIDDFTNVDVKIDFEKETGGFSDYPNIVKLTIEYSEKQVAVSPIEPVVIGEDGEQEESSKSYKAKQIKNQIASLMQIPEEIITVIEKR